MTRMRTRRSIQKYVIVFSVATPEAQSIGSVDRRYEFVGFQFGYRGAFSHQLTFCFKMFYEILQQLNPN